MRGTLFLHNAATGYDHVVRIACNPQHIGSNDLSLQARMSLYIPTNNVGNLFHSSETGSSPKIISYE